jgi:hypothetical protein
MLNLPITRSQGEMLVDLLEGEPTIESQDERNELAAEIRRLFGMSTKERSDEVKQKFGPITKYT